MTDEQRQFLLQPVASVPEASRDREQFGVATRLRFTLHEGSLSLVTANSQYDLGLKPVNLVARAP